MNVSIPNECLKPEFTNTYKKEFNVKNGEDDFYDKYINMFLMLLKIFFFMHKFLIKNTVIDY